MKKLVGWLRQIYLEFKDNEDGYVGVHGWWLAVKAWWHYRPQLMACPSCKRKMWGNKSAILQFCSENCSYYYDPELAEADDEIPF